MADKMLNAREQALISFALNYMARHLLTLQGPMSKNPAFEGQLPEEGELFVLQSQINAMKDSDTLHSCHTTWTVDIVRDEKGEPMPKLVGEIRFGTGGICLTSDECGGIYAYVKDDEVASEITIALNAQQGYKGDVSEAPNGWMEFDEEHVANFADAWRKNELDVLFRNGVRVGYAIRGNKTVLRMLRKMNTGT